MRNDLLLLLCLLWNMQHLYAQTPNSFDYQWATQAGGADSEELTKLKYDAAGNQYLLGSFMGSVTLDDAHTITSPNTMIFLLLNTMLPAICYGLTV
jgi:hypothetical protein